MKYFDQNYDNFFKNYVSKIGLIFNKDELFKQKSKIREMLFYEGFFHSMDSPIKNNYMIVNGFCHSESGKFELFEPCRYPTYNASSYQGYVHKAWDFSVFPFDRYKNGKNEVVNPFPVEMKVYDIIDENYPEKDGAKEDYAKYGKAVKLIYRLTDDRQLNQQDSVSIKLLFAHLGEIYVKAGDIVKPGQAIGKVGFSGYTSFKGQHTHFEVFLFDTKIDPFEWEMVKPDMKEKLAYMPFAKKYYPYNYTCPEINSSFKCWIKQNSGNSYGTHIEYKPGKRYFYLLSEQPLKNVLMYSNPWGRIKPINWEGKLGYWASYWLNKLMGKSGCYLFDVCEKVEEREVKFKVYRNPETLEISNRKKSGFTETIEKTYYKYTITVKSIKPKDEKGYGLYTYYPISKQGTYGTKFTIELLKG